MKEVHSRFIELADKHIWTVLILGVFEDPQLATRIGNILSDQGLSKLVKTVRLEPVRNSAVLVSTD